MFLSAQILLPEAQNDFLMTWLSSPLSWVLVWLAAMNLITFLVFGLDKGKARWKTRNAAVRRIPERTLFLLAAAGGSLGALLGMRLFHHKTLHRSFRLGIPAILILQLLLALGCFVLFTDSYGAL